MFEKFLDFLAHTETWSLLVIIGALGLFLTALAVSKIGGVEFDWTAERRRTVVILSVIFILVGLLVPLLAASQRTEPSTFRGQLNEFKNKSVTVFLHSSGSLAGKIYWVGDDYLVLTNVTGKAPDAKDILPFSGISYVRT